MRIFDTKLFIDRHHKSISEYYNNIITDDIQNPSTMRALLECKLYHLPRYFSVDVKTRGVLNSVFRRAESLTSLEYDLLHPNVSLQGAAKREACPQCSKYALSIEIGSHSLCTTCWGNLLHKVHSLWKSQITWAEAPLRYFNLREPYHQSERVPGYEWFWDLEQWKDLCELDSIVEMKAEFAYILKAYRYKSEPYVAHSPKHTLLAAILGCTKCDTRHAPSNIWTEPAVGWMDGICPSCTPKRGSWYNSKYEPIGYDFCVGCGTNHMPYAMWGLCQECYMNWQDAYLDPKMLFETAYKYGATSLLLLRPELTWVKYIKHNLPTSYSEIIQPYPKQRTKIDLGIKTRVQEVVGCIMTKENLYSSHQHGLRRNC